MFAGKGRPASATPEEAAEGDEDDASAAEDEAADSSRLWGTGSAQRAWQANIAQVRASVHYVSVLLLCMHASKHIARLQRHRQSRGGKLGSPVLLQFELQAG